MVMLYILNGDPLFRIQITPMLKLYVYMSKKILDPTKMIMKTIWMDFIFLTTQGIRH